MVYETSFVASCLEMTKSKKRNNYIHFKRRIKQRYGVTIDRQEYRALIRKIQNNKSVCLGRQSSNRTVHQVPFRGVQIIVIYDSRASNIVTTIYPGRSYHLR